MRKIDVEAKRPQAAGIGSTPSGCGLSFESVVAHGGGDPGGVPGRYVEDGAPEYAANGQKKGRRVGV